MHRLILILGFIFSFLIYSCGPSNEKTEKQSRAESGSAVLTGKQLSLRYCQSCHLYPEPDLLDKYTWERSVLPLMGRMFGIYEDLVPRSKVLEGAVNKKSVEAMNIFPREPSISDNDWQKIVDYYLSEAPEPLPANFQQDLLVVGARDVA